MDCIPATLALTAVAALSAAAQETHQDVAAEMVQLLTRAAEVLASCTDDCSARAALPELQKLADKASQLVQRQSALPEPTVQDYMAAQDLAKDFLQAKHRIREQMERLQKEGLLTPEMGAILKWEPEKK